MSEEKQEEKKSTPLRTVTEFSSLTIRQATEAKAKLVGEGVAPEQLGEKLGEAVGVTGDRLARLVEAVEAVGDRAARVRLVRVFGGEAEPRGGVKVGEHYYVVDLQPDAGGGGRRDARGGGRGGRGERGRGGGGERGRGGGERGRGGGGGERGGFGASAFGPPKPKAPRGLGSLVKAERAGGGGPREEREERGGPMPLAGAGWMVTKDPSAPFDRKGRGFDKKRGKGPRRGPNDRRDARGPGGGGPGGGGPGGGDRDRWAWRSGSAVRRAARVRRGRTAAHASARPAGSARAGAAGRARRCGREPAGRSGGREEEAPSRRSRSRAQAGDGGRAARAGPAGRAARAGAARRATRARSAGRATRARSAGRGAAAGPAAAAGHSGAGRPGQRPAANGDAVAAAACRGQPRQLQALRAADRSRRQPLTQSAIHFTASSVASRTRPIGLVRAKSEQRNDTCGLCEERSDEPARRRPACGFDQTLAKPASGISSAERSSASSCRAFSSTPGSTLRA